MIDGGLDEAAALNVIWFALLVRERSLNGDLRRHALETLAVLPKATAAFDRDDFDHTSHKQSADCRSFAECF